MWGDMNRLYANTITYYKNLIFISVRGSWNQVHMDFKGHLHVQNSTSLLYNRSTVIFRSATLWPPKA